MRKYLCHLSLLLVCGWCFYCDQNREAVHSSQGRQTKKYVAKTSFTLTKTFKHHPFKTYQTYTTFWGPIFSHSCVHCWVLRVQHQVCGIGSQSSWTPGVYSDFWTQSIGLWVPPVIWFKGWLCHNSAWFDTSAALGIEGREGLPADKVGRWINPTT